MKRPLNELQQARLDKLHGDTRVVGWHKDGPLVLMPNGLVRVVNADGRVRVVPRAVAVAV